MKDFTNGPQSRDDLTSITRAAVESVPADLSARRRHVRVLAAVLLPTCLAAPFLGSVSEVAIAVLVVLALLVRLGALVFVLRGMPRQSLAVPHVQPRVTVLLPLRDEAAVVEGLVGAVRGLDYPVELLEVIALVEADDPTTLTALRRHAPAWWRIAVLPDGRPRTKPRACNVGLALAHGDVVVVFDGEDRPDPDQARKAVAALAADRRLAVVQARLGCDHAGPGASLLVRCWALEYAVLFGAIQPALAKAGLPFLLGGTSNWFRADVLRDVGGWDAHNVTEDADLGVRLARAGWSSSVIDSTTWEEAPIHLGQWVRQRSRWLKGFAVTTAAHISRPDRFLADLGPVGALAVIAQLLGTLVCAGAYPVGLWFAARAEPSALLTILAMFACSIAVALHLVVARRERMPMWLAPLMLVYWVLQPAAVALAAIDLFRSPTRWRKTAHGLVERPRDGGEKRRRSRVVWAIRARRAPAPAANIATRPAAARRE